MDFLPENPNFADILDLDIIDNSQPISLRSSQNSDGIGVIEEVHILNNSGSIRPIKYTGQRGEFRSIEEIDSKYRSVFTYPYFNLVQSRVIEDALYSDKSMVVCAPTGSGKTVVFEMAIVQLLMDIEDKNYKEDFKIIYMAPVKALCTERLTEWYSKFTKLGLLCIEVTGDTDVEFPQLKPYKIIITTPEKWDMLTRRWRDYRGLVEVVKLFLIDEVHILNDNVRGPVLEAVVSRMKTIESSVQSAHRIEQLQKQYRSNQLTEDVITPSPRIRFVAVSATVNNPEDVAAWLSAADKPAVYYKFGDECRPVKLMRVVEGYSCPPGTSIFKFDIILNYKLWPIIQRYHNGKPTLIFCNTRKSVTLTAEALSREITINFNPEQKAKLMALASTLKNKKLQTLILNGVGCHHAGLLFEERMNIERAFRNRELPILITTTTLAMGVNLPAHLVIIKNTQQYVNGAYQEYSISTILQMVGRAGRPQFDTEATAVIMTRMADKARYQALVEGTEPLQSFLHKSLAENLNSEAALRTVTDVAQCVQWVNSTFLSVRAVKDPRRYLGLPQTAPANEISKKIEELCVKAMNRLASSGLITMDEASCIESTEAGKLMSMYYVDLGTMKLIMKIEGSETLDRLLWLICESHELSDMHLRVDERRCLNTLNRSSTTATIRFPMKGKISSRQMKLNCVIQAVLGCLPIPDPSLNQEAMKILRIASRVCKCLVAYTTRATSVSEQPKTFSAVLNSIVLAKCLAANLWENSPYVSKQLRGIGPAFSMLLASAGKTNFLLLEESHPRDLERIINKGPPAGNVIRKQISLLPKYQLVITQIDRDRINIKLTLLNQSYLSENLEHFTAGDNHKSYIIVGDSENYLLYLKSFKDTDLIKIYDGCITFDINRKHNNEHKVMAHCVSSSFAGIDVQTEYSFIETGHIYNGTNKCKNVSGSINTSEEKTTDRKRKVNKNTEVVCSKDKIKKNNTLLENFKCLKESFTKTTDIMTNLNKSTDISNNMLRDLTLPKCININKCINVIDVKDTTKNNIEKFMNDDSPNKHNIFQNYEDEDKVNNILIEIENEMGTYTAEPEQDQESLISIKLNNKDRVYCNVHTKETGRTHKKHLKSNFNLLDKDLNDENDDILISDNIEGFTNAVKFKIDKYLQNAEITTCNKSIKDILQIQEEETIYNKNYSIDRMEVNEHFNDDCLIQKSNFIIQNNNSIGDGQQILVQDIVEKAKEGYSRTLTHDNTLLKDICDDAQDIIKCNEARGSNQQNILATSQHNDECKVMENGETTIMRKDILVGHDKDNFKEINYTAETKTEINTIDNAIKKIHNICNANVLHEINKPLAISRIRDETPIKDLESASPLFQDTKQHKINEHDSEPSSSALDPVLIFDNGEKQENDISKPCLENVGNNFQIRSPIAQCSTLKNFNSCGTLNKIHVQDQPVSLIEKDAIRIEKYCFRTSEFNILTQSDSAHTIKIISNLKIDFDLTKFVAPREATNISDSVVIGFEKNNTNDTKMIEPDFNILKMNNDVQSPSKFRNNIKNNNNNALRDFNENLDMETLALETVITETTQPTSNQFNTSVDKVKDILKKYSIMISSRASDTLEDPVTFEIRNDNLVKIPTHKPKRRYKISDINSQVPLSKKLLQNDCNKFNSNIIERRLNEVDEILCDGLPTSEKFSCEINNEYKINSAMLSPKKSRDLTKINLDLNKTVLNPKTLLECYNNDTDVIPPPPEFADIVNLSTDTYASNAYTPVSPDYNPEIYNHYEILNETCDYGTRDDRNIFNTFSPDDDKLTSSKKVETSTSYEDNVQSKPFYVQNQINQDKIIRSLSTDIRTLFMKNRNAKLNEFKYKRKNILKLRK